MQAGGIVIYTAGESGVSLAPQLQVSSSTGSYGSTVLLTEGQHRPDLLSFAAEHGIAGHFDAENGRLVLSGKTSVGDYQDTLRRSSSVCLGWSRWIQPSRIGARSPGWSGMTPADPNLRSPLSMSGHHRRRNLYATVAVDYVPVQSSVPLAPDLVVTSSTGTVDAATVAIISGFLKGDELNVVPLGRVTARYDATTGQLTLTGTADSAADYQTMLRSVEYRFAVADDWYPHGSHRIIVWAC